MENQQMFHMILMILANLKYGLIRIDDLFLLIDMELERSNFSRAEELKADFKIICLKMCEKMDSITQRLRAFDNKDES